MPTLDLSAGMTERELTEHVRVTLAALPGVEAYHTHDSRRSEPGFPDFVVLVGDRAWAIELKTATGRVTPAQTRWLAAFGRLPRWRALVVVRRVAGEVEQALETGAFGRGPQCRFCPWADQGGCLPEGVP